MKYLFNQLFSVNKLINQILNILNTMFDFSNYPNFPYSVYIARVSNWHDVDSIKRICDLYRLGIVTRVDFQPIPKKRGCKSVIIQFQPFPYKPAYEYNEEFWINLRIDKTFKIQVSKKEYWICMKNKKPIKNSVLKTNQATIDGQSTNLVDKQNLKIHQLENSLKELTEKVEGLQECVYQLTAGLFNQKTQNSVIDDFMTLLYPKIFYKDYNEWKEEEETSKWEYWPTTRQGDECERRIEQLEKYLFPTSYEDYQNELVEKQLERQRIWREEDRYEEIQFEAAVDRAASDFW